MVNCEQGTGWVHVYSGRRQAYLLQRKQYRTVTAEKRTYRQSVHDIPLKIRMTAINVGPQWLKLFLNVLGGQQVTTHIDNGENEETADVNHLDTPMPNKEVTHSEKRRQSSLHEAMTSRELLKSAAHSVSTFNNTF